MMRRALMLTVLALLAVAPLVLPEFQVTLLNYIGLASIITLGLVLLTGIGGLTSFGQAAFVGLGAYTTAVLTTQYGVSPWLTLPAGLALTFVVALCLGFITLRLSGTTCRSARLPGASPSISSLAISTCSASIPASPRFRR
jgi:branched-chain amino acid transport system permease protein